MFKVEKIKLCVYKGEYLLQYESEQDVIITLKKLKSNSMF